MMIIKHYWTVWKHLAFTIGKPYFAVRFKTLQRQSDILAHNTGPASMWDLLHCIVWGLHELSDYDVEVTLCDRIYWGTWYHYQQGIKHRPEVFCGFSFWTLDRWNKRAVSQKSACGREFYVKHLKFVAITMQIIYITHSRSTFQIDVISYWRIISLL